jgi:hypothetical protein
MALQIGVKEMLGHNIYTVILCDCKGDGTDEVEIICRNKDSAYKLHGLLTTALETFSKEEIEQILP